jgi:hypothetical protein
LIIFPLILIHSNLIHAVSTLLDTIKRQVSHRRITLSYGYSAEHAKEQLILWPNKNNDRQKFEGHEIARYSDVPQLRMLSGKTD